MAEEALHGTPKDPFPILMIPLKKQGGGGGGRLKLQPENEANEGGDTNVEEQARKSLKKLAEEQTKKQVEEQVKDQAEDNNSKKDHKEEVTTMTEQKMIYKLLIAQVDNPGG